MSQTQVLKGDALSRKLFSVALFAQTQRMPGFGRQLTGPSADAGQAISKIKGQSVPDMPIVRVTDLSKTSGDTISLDLFGVIGGAPITGDQIAEGRGEKLTSSSMDISINLMTKVVDAGGKMSQQRTLQDLRTIAMAQLTNYFARLDDQSSLVFMAGARGFQSQNDWVVPLASDANFADVMVNTVQAPTYNRHFVASGTTVVKGGLQLASIATTDVLKLEHIDALRTYIDELEYPLQPVRIADDPAAADDPMWVMYVTPRQYSSLLSASGTTALRTFQQNAWNRASYGSKHPLFKGEVGMWNGILVKKLNRAVRFYGNVAQGNSVQYIAQGNAATAVESTTTIPGGFGTTFAVDRAILLGAQALGNVYGKNKSSDYFFSWLERNYNFERNLEVAGDCMGGKAKLRFNYDESGVKIPTDHGVMVLDTAVPLT
jgi:N4-gp56 family major capsid protein